MKVHLGTAALAGRTFFLLTPDLASDLGCLFISFFFITLVDMTTVMSSVVTSFA
jgi:hypothetical protein